MKIVSLNCNNCGAPLEASRKARFVTCTFCDARLEIKDEGAATWTEEFEELRSDVRDLQRNSELEQLDREWRRTRRRYRSRTRRGHIAIPTKTDAFPQLIFLTIIALILIGATFGTRVAGIGYLVGSLLLLIGFLRARRTLSKARALGRARHEYQERRRKLMRATRRYQAERRSILEPREEAAEPSAPREDSA